MKVATMLSTLAQVTNAPSDPDWHDYAVLLSELATLNAHIARYITRALDVDAERGDAIKDTEEAALGQTLVDLGERLRERSQYQPKSTPTAASHPNPSWSHDSAFLHPLSNRLPPEGGRCEPANERR